jgi:hypothetical protein
MINYRVTQSTSKSDGFSQILREAQEYFAGEHLQMLGTGISEILSENTLFGAYKDKMLAGLTASEAAVLEQLMENTRTHVLSESALAGIQPIASLALPTLRKSWPRVGVQHAIPTEAVKLPKFAISYMTPYILDAQGVKKYLPEALLHDTHSGVSEREKSVQTYQLTANGGAAITSLDLFADVALAGVDISVGDSIDVDAAITEVSFGVGVTNVNVACNIKLDTKTGTFYGEVAGNGETDTIFGKLDRGTATLVLATVKGAVDRAKVTFYLSSEMNNSSETVGFDVNLKDIDIPTGNHLTAPLPTEWLQDTMALYQIDGAAKVIDIMSDVLAQKIDLEGISMLKVDANAGSYKKVFDCRPRPGYAGSPKEWREELKTVIDHVATTMKNDSFFQNGKFSIMANGLETQLLPNINWSFTAGSERGGVEANYGVGQAQGAHSYTVVSTPNVASGNAAGNDVFVVFIPSNPDQMTYKFYPYAYSVERNNGYKDPNRPNVPGVLMTRRHVFESFTKLAGAVSVKNNDASGAYSASV